MFDRLQRRGDHGAQRVGTGVLGVWVSLSVLLLGIGAGCGTNGPAFEEQSHSQGAALVYIFRQSRTGGSASAFKIFANGVHVTNMSNGGYFPHAATPGELHIKAQMKANALNWGPMLYMTDKPELTIQVEAGKTYYVEFEFGGTGGPGLALISDEAGKSLIRSCKRTKTES